MSTDEEARQVPPRHPAKFSDPILDALGRLLRAEQQQLGRPITVLDPFAGIGRVHQLARPGKIETVGIEIEHEWAGSHADTFCDDSLAWMRRAARQNPSMIRCRFDVIVTSPTYGNRLADHHEARDGSERRSYKHDLGRDPSEGSSSTMHYGPEYWRFHAEAYRLMLGVVPPGGLALINVSNFYRGKREVPAVEWHRGALFGAGWEQGGRDRRIDTTRMTFGENRERSEGEVVFRMRRPVR